MSFGLDPDVHMFWQRGRFLEAARIVDAKFDDLQQEDDKYRNLVTAGFLWMEAGHYRRAAVRMTEAENYANNNIDDVAETLRLAAVARSALNGEFDAPSVDLIIEDTLSHLVGLGPGERRTQRKIEADRQICLGNWRTAEELLESALSLDAGRTVLLTACTARVLIDLVHCRLSQGNVDAARALLDREKSKDTDSCCRFRHLACEVDVSLAEGLLEKAKLASEEFLRLSDGMTSYEVDRRAADRRIRVLLVSEQGCDPASPLHPAFSVLRSLRRKSVGLVDSFNANLLILDYRVACFKYSIGEPLSEELFGALPGLATHPNKEEEASAPKRLLRVETSLKRLRALSAAVDNNFGSQHYSSLIDDRSRKIRQLADLLQ